MARSMWRALPVLALAASLAGCVVYQPPPTAYPAYPAYPPVYYAAPAYPVYPAFPPVYGAVRFGFGFGGGWHHHHWH